MKIQYAFLTIMLSMLLTGCRISSQEGLVVNTQKIPAEDMGHEINAGLREILSDQFANHIIKELNDMLDDETGNLSSSEYLETEEWY